MSPIRVLQWCREFRAATLALALVGIGGCGAAAGSRAAKQPASSGSLPSAASVRSQPNTADEAGGSAPGSPSANTSRSVSVVKARGRSGSAVDGDAEREQRAREQALAVRYPFHDAVPVGRLARAAPANKYANMAPGQCRAELKRRKLPFRIAGAVGGVAAPVRIDGTIRGVQFRAPGKRSVYGVLDCRLALVLDDFAEVLARHQVTHVWVDNMYRPRARLPGRRNKKSQHAYGLAIDLYGFTLSDGRTFKVEEHWTPGIGIPPCGPAAKLTAPASDHVVSYTGRDARPAAADREHHENDDHDEYNEDDERDDQGERGDHDGYRQQRERGEASVNAAASSSESRAPAARQAPGVAGENTGSRATSTRSASGPATRVPSRSPSRESSQAVPEPLNDGVEAGGAGEANRATPHPVSADSKDPDVLLRNLICDVARASLFHHILTPNYDAAHRNHFHLDIKRDAKEFSVR